MNPTSRGCASMFGLSLLAFTGWSASITYPNRAYIGLEGFFAPLPEAFCDVKAAAVEGDKVLTVTRDGRLVALGLSEYQRPAGSFEGLTNIVDVGLNHTMAAALTANGTVIEFGDPSYYPQPEGLTNVIAFDVAGQAGDDDLDYKIAVTSEGQVVVWGHFGHPPSAEIPGAVAVAGGWSHIVALKSDGTLAAWGQSYYGGSVEPPAELTTWWPSPPAGPPTWRW